ncbi:MAG: DUF4302 domain-containing protein [Rikenellaceae bacterium]|jgi:hypothetical protein|nr:DUF4302 domain-containing protein [Rikenellaceae bacterium]
MKKLYSLLLAGVALASVGCNEYDYTFDEPVSERIATSLERYKAALRLSGTWVLEYFPGETLQYGGWVYIVEFQDDRFVKAWFEGSSLIPKAPFASTPPLTVSEYQVEFSTAPMLKFNTHNDYLHYFAYPDGENGGYRGREGDFEFILMSMTPAMDEIILRGSRTGNRMRMTPLSGEYTPDSYLAAVTGEQVAVTQKDFRIMVDGRQIGTAERKNTLLVPYLSYFDQFAASKTWTLRYTYPRQAVGTDGNPLTDESGAPVMETVEVLDRICVIHLPDGEMKLYEPYLFRGDAVSGLGGESIGKFIWTLGETSAGDCYVAEGSKFDIRLIP